MVELLDARIILQTSTRRLSVPQNMLCDTGPKQGSHAPVPSGPRSDISLREVDVLYL
jgi:hypothetical protein